MKNAIFTLALTGLLILAGCQSKIDTSTDESLKNSIEKINKNLSEDKREEFKSAVFLVMGSGMDFGMLMGGEQTVDLAVSAGKQKLDGKTADEVIQLAAQIKEERRAKKEEAEKERRAQLIKEINREISELRTKEERTKKALENMKTLAVTNSRFWKKKQRFLGPKSVIDLKVVNGTGKAISAISFIGTYATPSREIPWLVSDLSVNIAGGLEPGEEAEWSVTPNMFGDWGKMEVQDGAVLTLEVVGIDGAGGTPLWAVEFGNWEKSRLAELESELKSLMTAS